MIQPLAGMMAPSFLIRVITLALIKQDTCIFVSKCDDVVKQDCFYRALGGGVEFGETSQEALQREFWEELGAELTNIQYLCCLENLFTYNGKPGHELVQVYQCDFVDRRFYQSESFTACEGSNEFIAFWEEGERFKSGELRLVPEGFLQFL
ncbi:MAG TPA: NUDIX hydrolase [Coleofasciculaceae cyanobacterium]